MMQHSTHVHYCYLLNSFTMPPICYLLKAICAVRMYMETTIASTMCSETSFGDKMVPVWGHGDKGAILGTVPDFWGQLAPMLALCLLWLVSFQWDLQTRTLCCHSGSQNCGVVQSCQV